MTCVVFDQRADVARHAKHFLQDHHPAARFGDRLGSVSAEQMTVGGLQIDRLTHGVVPAAEEKERAERRDHAAIVRESPVLGDARRATHGVALTACGAEPAYGVPRRNSC